ncbi:MAG: hypothetical protein YK1309IOTA_360007, partial [Marine Group I thaumarchaeote]
MGLFSRHKKTEEKSDDKSENYVEAVEPVSTETQEKSKHLESLNKKLLSVRSEYDVAVGKLMATKKELIQKNSEIMKKKAEYERTLVILKKPKSEISLLKS